MSNLVATMATPPFARRALAFWRLHEREIVIAGMLLGGFTFVGFMWLTYKATPLALKFALATPKGIATKAVLSKYGII